MLFSPKNGTFIFPITFTYLLNLIMSFFILNQYNFIMTWLDKKLQNAYNKNSSESELLDTIRYKKFRNIWVGLIFTKIEKDEFPLVINFTTFSSLNEHLVNKCFNNNYFMFIPGKSGYRSISYKELIYEWGEVFIRTSYKRKNINSEKIRNDVTIENDEIHGTYWSEDIELLEIVLFWKLWRKNFYTKKSIEEIHKDTKNEAKRLFNKFNQYFLITCYDRDDEKNQLFESIFYVLNGSTDYKDFESDSICVESVVMK